MPATARAVTPEIEEVDTDVEEVETQIEPVRVHLLPDGRLSRRDAAAYLGRSQKTLAQWHLMGKGPPSVLIGGRRFYYKNDLDRFIRAGS